MIARTIYQCFKAKQIPRVLRKSQRSWIELNPGYRYEFWTDEDIDAYVRGEHPEVLAVFDRANGIQKADIWRVLILYDRGGVYADLDCECLRPLDELFSKYGTGKVLAAPEPALHGTGGALCNAFMASPPRSALWEAWIEELRSFETADLNRNSLGPALLDRVARMNQDCVTVADENDIYPYADITVDDWKTRKSAEYRKSVKMLKSGDFGGAYVVHYWFHTDFVHVHAAYRDVRSYLRHYAKLTFIAAKAESALRCLTGKTRPGKA